MLCGKLNVEEIQKRGIYAYVEMIHFTLQHCEATMLQ